MKVLNEMKYNYEINIDQECIHIINYMKIKEISYNVISVELSNITINIVGNNLLIKKMNKHEMLIIGKVKGIDFIE